MPAILYRTADLTPDPVSLKNGGIRTALRGEWHLLKPLQMTMDSYLFASQSARCGEQRIRFWPSFTRPRLDAPGPRAHFALGNQAE